MPTKYSISAASRITGKSRTTISKHLKQGKLSCEAGGDGAKLIDASELMRVYGDACNFEVEEERGQRGHKVSETAHPTEQGGQVEVATLKTQLDKEVAERERERAHYREQIAHLESALERAQEGHNRATLLLENHTSGGGELHRKLEDLHGQLQSVREDAKAEAREEMRSEPWWRLLGTR